MGAFCGRGHFDRTVDSVTGAIYANTIEVLSRDTSSVLATLGALCVISYAVFLRSCNPRRAAAPLRGRIIRRTFDVS